MVTAQQVGESLITAFLVLIVLALLWEYTPSWFRSLSIGTAIILLVIGPGRAAFDTIADGGF